jgi:hypothetical protein
MPDLIRHPDIDPTPFQVRGKLQSGTIPKTIPVFTGMTMRMEGAIDKQTVMNPVLIRGNGN